MNSVKIQIDKILDDIKNYSQEPDKVKLIAVTKYVGTDEIEKVLEAGINNIGENKGQSIRDKSKYFKDKKVENIKWHFIGALQSNKIKYIAEYIELIHSVDNLELAEQINKKAKEYDRVINILLEVNVAGEETKQGYEPQKLFEEASEYLKFENIKVVGLMTMAPNTTDDEEIRNVFRNLREMKEELNKKVFHGQLTELSMGMSNDYKIALQEGATYIRVGSKIFN